MYLDDGNTSTRAHGQKSEALNLGSLQDRLLGSSSKVLDFFTLLIFLSPTRGTRDELEDFVPRELLFILQCPSQRGSHPAPPPPVTVSSVFPKHLECALLLTQLSPHVLSACSPVRMFWTFTVQYTSYEPHVTSGSLEHGSHKWRRAASVNIYHISRAVCQQPNEK